MSKAKRRKAVDSEDLSYDAMVLKVMSIMDGAAEVPRCRCSADVSGGCPGVSRTTASSLQIAVSR